MSIKIFDTHCHYDDEVFDGDRDELLIRQVDFGVDKILNCAVDIESCEKIVSMVEKYNFIYGACGIHPSYSKYYYKTDYIDNLYRFHSENKKILAVGEIGLDYFYKDLDVSVQKEVFMEQLKLARDIDKPVVIHCRDAHQDTLNIVKKFMPLRGVIHCFSGSLDIAKEWVKLGFYLGISGIVTFKNAVKILDVVREIPIKHLITETDCPYLSPVPHRGKRNESINIEHIIRKIAEVKNEDFYEIADTLYRNAVEFLNL